MIPEKYRKSPESITTYDWTDIADASGIIQLYCLKFNEAGGASYVLTSSENLYSEGFTPFFEQAAASGSTTTTFTSYTFNKPFVIAGKVFFGYNQQLSVHLSGNCTNTMRFVLSRVSGGVTTELCDVTSGTSGIFSNTTQRMWNNVSDTITATNIKVGDYLTLAITITGTGGSGTFRIWCTSPNISSALMGETGYYPPSIICSLPRRIDI